MTQLQGLKSVWLHVISRAVINADEKLREFLPALQAADWLALDTEADSLHAYPEKLCLIQLTTRDGDFLLDPLSGMDLQPLWQEFKKHQLILHGADYDLRLLRKNHSFVPERIFDTMLASRLLGEREFGLGSLVKKHLGIVLEKGSQKADWARRPLTPKMEDYARADTRHLKPLSDLLRSQLAAKGRLAWLEESCQRLVADCAVAPKPDPDLVWRLKGSHKLSRGGLAVLREIWRWREHEAVAANRPPYFVLNHETMVDIAAAVSEHRPVDGLVPRHLSTRRKDGLAEATQRGLRVEPRDQPEALRHQHHRQTEAQRQRFIQLENHRNACAAELGLDPTVIASRATLLALASDWQANEGELMKWQCDLLKSK